jgi:hypothetical protein
MIAAVLGILFWGCQGAHEREEGKILFDIGYGKSDSTLSLSGSALNPVWLSMNKGIIHILSTNEAKILRISSYGQTLAMWYDPAKGSMPLILKSFSMKEALSEPNLGRFAMRVSFDAPSCMAVDSRQVICIADSGIVRRFDSNGLELQPIGKEGLGSTQFSNIIALFAQENDNIAVRCLSESGNTIYFYDKNGTFLNNLQLNDDRIPLPASLAEKYPSDASSRIVATLESIVPRIRAAKRTVALKANYYLEKYDPQTKITLSIEPLSSWIIEVDATTGAIIDSFPLSNNTNESGVDQQLVAARTDGFVCIRWHKTKLGGEVIFYSQKGTVMGKRDFVAPDSNAELVALAVGDDGFLYILGKLPSTLRLYSWQIPKS